MFTGAFEQNQRTNPRRSKSERVVVDECPNLRRILIFANQKQQMLGKTTIERPDSLPITGVSLVPVQDTCHVLLGLCNIAALNRKESFQIACARNPINPCGAFRKKERFIQ